MLAACSSMDEIRVRHACADSLEVVVTHLHAIEPSGGEQEYWEQTFEGKAPSREVATVAGIVNMYPYDVIRVAVMGSRWERELTRDELRALDGPIEIPMAACL